VPLGWYESKLKEQGGKCAICGSKKSRSGISDKFFVDHDHNCCGDGCKNCIRGLLCSWCNFRLGYSELMDKPDLYSKAEKKYLKKYKKSADLKKRRK
jgi:hypothetical protein